MKAGLISVAVTALFAAPTFGQWTITTPGIPRLANGKPTLSAPAPRTSDGKPDLTGIWQAGRAGAAGQYGYDYNVAQDLPPDAVTPWAQSVRQQRVQNFRKDSPLSHCMPVSVPFLNFRGLSRIVQTPGLIVILYESPNSPHRTIFMDGRELPKDPDPTWLGYSVGHWEGDTLVVNSIGFNEQGWLDVGGNPQTEALRMTERFRRRDAGHMDLQVTLEDPLAYNRSWTLPVDLDLMPDGELIEYICENEKDKQHMVGKRPEEFK